ncbi:hypothetical protein ABW20_dc0110439 [Dactylellina cionopaga]|nr:hypothetical protein ABW20_dc0110439 [Dactylellina cionopaga]
MPNFPTLRIGTQEPAEPAVHHIDQHVNFEEWMQNFAEYLKCLNTTIDEAKQSGFKTKYLKYDNIPTTERARELWARIIPENMRQFASEIEACLGRAEKANLDVIPRSNVTPAWLCSKHMSNRSIPVLEKWRCDLTKVGTLVWYGFYMLLGDLAPACAKEYCSKLAVYGLSDWGDSSTMFQIFKPPMFSDDAELLAATKKIENQGFDAIQDASSVLVELWFEKLMGTAGFVKWSYEDYNRISFIGSKVFPGLASLDRTYESGGLGETVGVLIRIIHDVIDFVSDVMHGDERDNFRLQHDLACANNGCIWSEFNRVAARVDKLAGHYAMGQDTMIYRNRLTVNGPAFRLIP